MPKYFRIANLGLPVSKSWVRAWCEGREDWPDLLSSAPRSSIGDRPCCLLPGLELSFAQDVDEHRKYVSINHRLWENIRKTTQHWKLPSHTNILIHQHQILKTFHDRKALFLVSLRQWEVTDIIKQNNTELETPRPHKYSNLSAPDTEDFPW